jgi:hypothetical protein
MTIQEIAIKILDRRNNASPIVMIGEMNQILGDEGFSEAMRRGWIIADHDTGHLQVSNLQARIEEMREISEYAAPGTAHQVGDTVLVAEDGQVYNAVVQGQRPDGSYILSFGDKKPRAGGEKPYKAEELKAVSRPEVSAEDPTRIRRHVPVDDNSRSTTPAPATATASGSGPRGPGIG